MDIFENKFRGNNSAMEKMLSTFQKGGVTAFTGAGTSMPALPGWGQLIAQLVDDAANEGKLESDTANALRSESSDFLYVVDEIYGAVGRGQTRTKVSKLFAGLNEPTDAHQFIVETTFDRILTLNYDLGLEMAHSKKYGRHITSVTGQQLSEADDWIRHATPMESSAILHWHGICSDAESIILSGADYVAFYDTKSTHKEMLRTIFKTRQVLMIGFGFSDPFIEREFNSVMQPIQALNSHFAIIGVPEDSPFNVALERKKFATKYKLEPIFYPVTRSDNGQNHDALLSILEVIASAAPREKSNLPDSISSHQNSTQIYSTTSYRTNLFTIGTKQIYCEPNIWRTSVGSDELIEAKTTIDDIIKGTDHCSIEAPHEYGLTNIGRRMAVEMEEAGTKVIFRDADLFPKYKRAILSDPEVLDHGSQPISIILDNFSPIEHLRTIREVIAALGDVRIIVLQRSAFGGAEEGLADLGFTAYQLRGLSRSDIRSVINTLAPTYDSDATSIIVDKVYTDLLQLCIPLTPSNVIMYSSVLCKDGTFSPVSRLHIVDRFVSEALQRASDAYADTFNSINKIDLISGFCFGLFDKSSTFFNLIDWKSYCSKYKSENLVEFNPSEIISDLLNGRIVTRDGDKYYFRYRMFFSYFVGRHIASRPPSYKPVCKGTVTWS